jgi:HSF-type DNA-binding
MMMQGFPGPTMGGGGRGPSGQMNSSNNSGNNAAGGGGGMMMQGGNPNNTNAAAAAAAANLMTGNALFRGGNAPNVGAPAGFNMMGMNMAALGNMASAGGAGGGAGGNGLLLGGNNNNMNLAAAAQAMNMNAAMQNFNLNDLRRLQQFQQLQNTNNAIPNASNEGVQLQNPGGGGGGGGMGSGPQQQDNLAALQSYLDQKIQSERFGGMGGMNALQGQNPMLAGNMNLLHERLMMNQNHIMGMGGVVAGAINVGTGNPGEVPLPSPHSLFHRDGSRRMRGGVIEPFPEKLHRLLLEVEAAGRGDVISFVANGRAFAIHKPDKFFKEIVPLYFRQSRLSSFKRQLNLYGFELINTGPARGGYYHELFVKERPELCRRMRRVAVKVAPKDGIDPTKPDKPIVSKDEPEKVLKETVQAKGETTVKKEQEKIDDDAKDGGNGNDNTPDSADSSDGCTPLEGDEAKENEESTTKDDAEDSPVSSEKDGESD